MRSPLARSLTLVFAVGTAAVLGLVTPNALAQDEPALHLEVLPKGLSKPEVKKIMKQWTRALGVECEFCHDLDDMAKDTKNKKIARQMVRMSTDINEKQLATVKNKVSCMTCHRGKKAPAKK